jgi:hypothetical protein
LNFYSNEKTRLTRISTWEPAYKWLKVRIQRSSKFRERANFFQESAAGNVAEVVEHLPGKYEAVTSNPSSTKKKKEIEKMFPLLCTMMFA